MTFLTVDDLPVDLSPASGLTVEQMVDDATALAVLAAPCLGEDPSPLSTAQQSAVRAILRGAILRWAEAGSGAMQSETIGAYGYTVDNRQQRKGMFWPSEITQLQGICQQSGAGGAFAIDQIPARPLSMADRPDLWFQYLWPVPPGA